MISLNKKEITSMNASESVRFLIIILSMRNIDSEQLRDNTLNLKIIMKYTWRKYWSKTHSEIISLRVM